MKNYLYLIAFALILGACQSEAKQTDTMQSDQTKTTVGPAKIKYKQEAAIEKPFANIEVPFESFNYNNRKGSTINLESGTQIRIPKNAFMDEDGNAVEKNIQVEYREFHDISDIMLSGIKMNTPDGDFESAGMFEIRAKSEGRDLDLKDDKEIDVEMASYKSGSFNSYELNEESQEWEYIEKSKAEQNTRKKDKLEAIAKEESETKEVCDLQPRKFETGDQIFDLDYTFGRHTALNFFNGAMWMIQGGADEEAAFLRDRKRYNELELVPLDTTCNLFSLKLWNKKDYKTDKNKTQYTVEPVWSGKQHDKTRVNFKERMQAYKDVAKRLAMQRRMAEREADLVRSFRLKGMGIYNCDRILDYVKMVTVGVLISCKEKIKNWWYITMNKSVAIKYYNPLDNNFKYNPSSENSIIAVLPNDKIGIVSSEQMEAAYEAFRSSNDPNKKMELELEIQGEPVADRKQFKNNVAKW